MLVSLDFGQCFEGYNKTNRLSFRTRAHENDIFYKFEWMSLFCRYVDIRLSRGLSVLRSFGTFLKHDRTCFLRINPRAIFNTLLYFLQTPCSITIVHGQDERHYRKLIFRKELRSCFSHFLIHLVVLSVYWDDKNCLLEGCDGWLQRSIASRKPRYYIYSYELHKHEFHVICTI